MATRATLLWVLSAPLRWLLDVSAHVTVGLVRLLLTIHTHLPRPIHDAAHPPNKSRLLARWWCKTNRTTTDAEPRPTPRHIALHLSADDALHRLDALAEVIAHAIDAGVAYFSAADDAGHLIERAPLVRSALARRGLDVRVLGPDDAAVSATAAEPTLLLVSKRSARDEIAAVARELCAESRAGRLAPDAIDERAVDRALAARRPRPEVALVLQFCDEVLLGGIWPWHSRVAHHVHLGPLARATRAAVERALSDYGSVVQRHGA
jgi:hypothetical protein